MYDYEKRKLSFQLVPSTSWYANLRSILVNWSEISNKIRQINKCEICGAENVEFDAHEVWKYDDNTHIQSLDNIICVCKDCHNAIHIGHTGLEGDVVKTLVHYSTINGISSQETNKDMNEAFAIWEQRSNYEWQLDPNLLQRVEELTGINCNFEEPINGRYYAKVSFDEKEDAKKLGAKWDGDRKIWYFSSKELRDAWYSL